MTRPNGVRIARALTATLREVRAKEHAAYQEWRRHAPDSAGSWFAYGNWHALSLAVEALLYPCQEAEIETDLVLDETDAAARHANPTAPMAPRHGPR